MLSKGYKELVRRQKEAQEASNELYRRMRESYGLPAEMSTWDCWPYYYIKDFLCWIQEFIEERNGKNAKEERR